MADARLKSALRMVLGDYERRLHRVDGTLGNGDGSTVDVASRSGFVWVRLPNREVLQVINTRVPSVYDLPVVIGYDQLNPDMLQVLGPNLASTGIDKDETILPQLNDHGHTHEWEADGGGYDPVQVHLRAFTPFRVTFTGGLTAHVHRGYVPLSAGGFTWVDHQDLDLTSSVPASLHRWVLIYADRLTGTVLTYDGDTEYTPTEATIPAPPSGGNLLAAVLLSAGQTELTEDGTTTHLADLRFMHVHDHDERYSDQPGAVPWKVSLFRDGDLEDTYDADADGLQDAIDDALSGDTIYATPATYSADFTVPAGVALVGLSRNDVIIDGKVNMEDGSSIQNLSVINEDTDSGTLIAVEVDASATASAIDVVMAVYQHGTGDSYAVHVLGSGSMQVRNSYVRATADLGGTPYGFYIEALGSAGARFCYINASYGCNSNSLLNSYANQYVSGTTNIGTQDYGDRATEDHTHSGSGTITLDFLDLTDTPASYSGEAGKIPSVNVGETALEFIDPPGGADVFCNIQGALVATTDVYRYVAAKDLTLETVLIAVQNQGSAGSTVVDVHLNGTTIFSSTKPTVAYNDADGNDEVVPGTTSVSKGDIITIDIDSVATGAEDLSVSIGASSLGGGASATDHGVLTGLADDDHTQYHNDTRGDARYSLLAHTHTESDITDLDHDAVKIQGIDVDDTDIADGKVLAYNSTSGNLEYEDQPTASTVYHQAVFTFTGTLSTGSHPIELPNATPNSLTLDKVYLRAGTAPTGAAVIVDVNVDGASVMSSLPQIAAGSNTGQSTSFSDSSWAANSYMTVDIDQVGSTVAGSDMVVVVVYH